MDGLFGWLGQLMSWLGAWIPRLAIVAASDAGVKLRYGNRVIPVGPGLHVWWPAVTRFITCNTQPQVLSLTSQTLTTGDGKAVLVSGMVMYEIVNAEKYIVWVHNADAAIDSLSLAAIRREVTHADWSALLVHQDDVDARLKSAISAAVRRFGVRVLQVRLTDCAETKVLSIPHATGGPAGVHYVPIENQ